VFVSGGHGAGLADSWNVGGWRSGAIGRCTHVVHRSDVETSNIEGDTDMKTGLLARRIGATLFMLVLAAGVAQAIDTPDAWVTMKAKIALMTTEGVSTTDLNVDTVKGVVTLHGKVATEAEKAKAENVARGIEGAKEVKNLLQVVPSAQRAVVERSDDLIKTSVEAAFKANRRVAASGIKVASVNKGVVLLSGKTKSLEAYLESVEVANAVRGVRRVSTEVEVVPAS
jgi:hyperosmotically inducible protein